MAVISSAVNSGGKISISGIRLSVPEWSPLYYRRGFPVGAPSAILGVSGISSTEQVIPSSDSTTGQSAYAAISMLVDFGPTPIDVSLEKHLVSFGSKLDVSNEMRLAIFVGPSGWVVKKQLLSSGSWVTQVQNTFTCILTSEPVLQGIHPINIGFLPTGDIRMSVRATDSVNYPIAGDTTHTTNIAIGPWTPAGLSSYANSIFTSSVDKGFTFVFCDPSLNPVSAKIHSLAYSERDSSNVGNSVLAPFVSSSATISTNDYSVSNRVFTGDAVLLKYTDKLIELQTTPMTYSMVTGSDVFYKWVQLSHTYSSADAYFATIPNERPDAEIFANAIYVGASGNDLNDGTMLRPVKTLPKAISLCKNNDIIITGDGIYSASGVTKSIRIIAREGASSVLSNFSINSANFQATGISLDGNITVSANSVYIEKCGVNPGTTLTALGLETLSVSDSIFKSNVALGACKTYLSSPDTLLSNSVFDFSNPGGDLYFNGNVERLSIRHNLMYGVSSSVPSLYVDAIADNQQVMRYLHLTEAQKSGAVGINLHLSSAILSSIIFDGFINELDAFVYGIHFSVSNGYLYILNPDYVYIPDDIEVLLIYRKSVINLLYNIFYQTNLTCSTPGFDTAISSNNIVYQSPGIILKEGFLNIDPQFTNFATGDFHVNNPLAMDITQQEYNRVSGSLSDNGIDSDVLGYRRVLPGIAYLPDIGVVENSPAQIIGSTYASESGVDCNNSGSAESPLRSLGRSYAASDTSVSVDVLGYDGDTSRAASGFYERTLPIQGGSLSVLNPRADIVGGTSNVEVMDSIDVHGKYQGVGAGIFSIASADSVVDGETVNNPLIPRDGSIGLPYKTIDQALASADGTILIESGDYALPTNDVGLKNTLVVIPKLSKEKIGDFHIKDVGPGTWSEVKSGEVKVTYKESYVEVSHV